MKVKHVTIKLLVFMAFVQGFVGPMETDAQEMRALQLEAQQARAELGRKAQEEKRKAEAAAEESRSRISQDKASLEKEISRLSSENDALTIRITELEQTSEELATEENTLNEQLTQVDGVVRELVGIIRSNAKDLTGLIEQNGMNALNSAQIRNEQRQDLISFLEAITENAHFPAMDDVRLLHDLLISQVRMSGEVSVKQGTIIDREGLEAPAEVLFIGPFTTIYRAGEETGYLNYSAGSGKLYALSNLPPSGMQNDLGSYLDGNRDSVIVDISRGAALRQLSHHLDLQAQIAGGGPIVWPILAILVVGLLIVLERTWMLMRKHHGRIDIFDRLRVSVREHDWPGGERVCEAYEKKPIGRVLMAGIRSYAVPREDLENVLQEAILREIPPLERFLSTLGMLVVIAPLLGLLGTVTGMINVFHVITLSGTGDPRLMSGGISEALVTTMLGLSVAIPLMLLHNVLNSTVDRMVSEMEEKSVALVNLIHKEREAP